MKVAIGVAVFVWLVSGLAGAWMLNSSGEAGLKRVAWGPITLVEAFKKEPATYSGF